MNLNPLKVGFWVVVAILAAIVLLRPDWISDSNAFLSGFVNYYYLSVLGVILSITVASLLQAHLNLTRIEEHRGRECFAKARKEIRNSALYLIGSFASALLVVVVKPLTCTTETETASANAAAIFIIAVYLLILLDVAMSVFAIRPEIDGNSAKKS